MVEEKFFIKAYEIDVIREGVTRSGDELREFSDEIETWVIENLKNLITARSVLNQDVADLTK